MVIKNKKEFDQKTEELYDHIFKGKRIYYPEPELDHDPRVGTTVTLFKVKQRIADGPLRELKNLEFPNRNDVGVDLYMTRICDRLRDDSWNNPSPKFSDCFENWGVSPFEEWIDEVHNVHWIYGQWFKDFEQFGTHDFALLLTFKGIVKGDIQEYKDEYGSALVMTKLGV